MNNQRSIHSPNIAWVAYLSPFRFVVPDSEEPISISLDDINSNSYDHGKLCRIVSVVSPKDDTSHNMVLCYDGALAIPRSSQFLTRESALQFFTKVLCQLTLGGTHCEAIDHRDIVTGDIHEDGLLWPVDIGRSGSSSLHSKLRMRIAGNIDSIILAHPKHISVSEFATSLDIGSKYFSNISNLTPSFLLRGITEYAYGNWSSALSNLWITIEQLTDWHWTNSFISNPSYHPAKMIEKRLPSLKSDSRTWSSSVKQEMLFQTGIFDESIYKSLFPARRARNRLVHDGIEVKAEIVTNLFGALCSMIEKAMNFNNIPLKESVMNIPTHPIAKMNSKIDMTAWNEIENKFKP